MQRSIEEEIELNKKAQRFVRCPACRGSNLLYVEGEALCAGCDWNSIALNVWAGEYDKFFALRLVESNAESEAEDKPDSLGADAFTNQFESSDRNKLVG